MDQQQLDQTLDQLNKAVDQKEQLEMILNGIKNKISNNKKQMPADALSVISSNCFSVSERADQSNYTYTTRAANLHTNDQSIIPEKHERLQKTMMAV